MFATILTICIIIAGIVIGLIVAHNDCYYADLYDYLFYGFIGFILAGAVSTMLWSPVWCKEPNCPSTYISEEHTQSIRAIKDNLIVTGEMSGNLFIRSGYIDEELHYFYLYEDEEGCFVQDRIPADKTKIKISDTENPCVITRTWKYKSTFYGDPEIGYDYIIVVPEDSVTEEINIDLE